MVVEVPGQGLLELAELGAHARAGQLGEHLGVTLPTDHCLEHLPARHPEDVACHTRQLDLGVLQELLHPLLLPGPLADQGAPVPGQVTQPADRGWRHEAWPAHAPLDHLGQPHRIELVGLGAAGDVLDVAGVEQPAGESFGFQQVERRLPVVAGGLHRDQCHASNVQPGGQVQQRPGCRGVLPDFLAAVSRLVVVGHSDAHRQGSLADVEGTDPLDQVHRLVGLLDVDHLHLVVLAGWEVARGANREERQADSRARSNNAGPLNGSQRQTAIRGSTGTKHRRRRQATSPIFTPARGVPPGHRRLLCLVKQLGGLRCRAGRSVREVGTAAGR